MDYEIPFCKKNHKTTRHVIECSSVVSAIDFLQREGTHRHSKT